MTDPQPADLLTVARLRELLADEPGGLIVYVGTKTEIAKAREIDHDTFENEVGPALLIEGDEDA